MSRFLPGRTLEIAQALEQDFFPAPEQTRLFRDVVRLVEDLERHKSSVALRVLEDLYGPYDPTAESPATLVAIDDAHVDRFFERLRHLLDRANFDLVPLEQLQDPSREQSLPKELKIDPNLEAIDRLAVGVRGVGRKAIVIRPWQSLFFKRVEVAAGTHLRVVSALRERGKRWVQVRVFRDVAHGDLDLLLPTVQVRMRLVDKLKLSSSGGAAALSVFKLARLALAYAAKFAVLQVIFLPLIVLVGGIYGGKTLFDYAKIKESYLTELARHVSELSIAADRASLALLAQMAADEETKEVLLAYALLAAAPEGRTPSELDDGIRSWLKARLGDSVFFDIGDALSKLDELALAKPRVEGTRARVAVSLEDACRALDRAWDELYTAPTPTSGVTDAGPRPEL